jgi:hypothetical protein
MGNVYAYSDDNKLIKKFIKTRDMTKFVSKKVSMRPSDLEELHESFDAGGMLLNYIFNQNGYEISLPVTRNEKMDFEGVGNKLAFVDIYTHAIINPDIFKGKLRELLRVIEYDKAYHGWKKGISSNTAFQPDMLSIFLELHGDTIDLGGLL